MVLPGPSLANSSQQLALKETGSEDGLHLFVVHHGLWGTPADTSFLSTAVASVVDPRHAIVLNAACNSGRATYDGIDVMAERLARLIRTFCARLAAPDPRRPAKRVTKLSLLGYSLGGLVVRYAAGRLAATGFFEHVQPMNLVTFASPHLGCWSAPDNAYRKLFNAVIPWTLSCTGAQLVLADDFVDGLPLLAVMAHPRYAFHAALGMFQKRIALANIRHDYTVQFCTAAMEMTSPYADHLPVSLNSRYPSIVQPGTLRKAHKAPAAAAPASAAASRSASSPPATTTAGPGSGGSSSSGSSNGSSSTAEDHRGTPGAATAAGAGIVGSSFQQQGEGQACSGEADDDSDDSDMGENDEYDITEFMTHGSSAPGPGSSGGITGWLWGALSRTMSSSPSAAQASGASQRGSSGNSAGGGSGGLTAAAADFAVRGPVAAAAAAAQALTAASRFGLPSPFAASASGGQRASGRPSGSWFGSSSGDDSGGISMRGGGSNGPDVAAQQAHTLASRVADYCKGTSDAIHAWTRFTGYKPSALPAISGSSSSGSSSSSSRGAVGSSSTSSTGAGSSTPTWGRRSGSGSGVLAPCRTASGSLLPVRLLTTVIRPPPSMQLPAIPGSPSMAAAAGAPASPPFVGSPLRLASSGSGGGSSWWPQMPLARRSPTTAAGSIELDGHAAVVMRHPMMTRSSSLSTLAWNAMNGGGAEHMMTRRSSITIPCSATRQYSQQLLLPLPQQQRHLQQLHHQQQLRQLLQLPPSPQPRRRAAPSDHHQRQQRLQARVFVVLLPLFLLLWGCMVLWLAVISAQHYLHMLALRGGSSMRDRRWNLRWQRPGGAVAAATTAAAAPSAAAAAAAAVDPAPAEPSAAPADVDGANQSCPGRAGHAAATQAEAAAAAADAKSDAASTSTLTASAPSTRGDAANGGASSDSGDEARSISASPAPLAAAAEAPPPRSAAADAAPTRQPSAAKSGNRSLGDGGAPTPQVFIDLYVDKHRGGDGGDCDDDSGVHVRLRLMALHFGNGHAPGGTSAHRTAHASGSGDISIDSSREGSSICDGAGSKALGEGGCYCCSNRGGSADGAPAHPMPEASAAASQQAVNRNCHISDQDFSSPFAITADATCAPGADRLSPDDGDDDPAMPAAHECTTAACEGGDDGTGTDGSSTGSGGRRSQGTTPLLPASSLANGAPVTVPVVITCSEAADEADNTGSGDGVEAEASAAAAQAAACGALCDAATCQRCDVAGAAARHTGDGAGGSPTPESQQQPSKAPPPATQAAEAAAAAASDAPVGKLASSAGPERERRRQQQQQRPPLPRPRPSRAHAQEQQASPQQQPQPESQARPAQQLPQPQPQPPQQPAPSQQPGSQRYPHRQAQLQAEMCAHLNELEWHKVHVDTRHYHAHAAIVVRSAVRFYKQHAHIVEYVVRQLRM